MLSMSRRPFELASLLFLLLLMLFIYTLISLSTPHFSHSVAFNTRIVVPRQRIDKSRHISIVIIVTDDTPLDAYSVALNSLDCYARLHGYHFVVLRDVDFPTCSRHKDGMFRRHCVLAYHLESTARNGGSSGAAGEKQQQWTLFLDADVAVVNPNKLIEEFIEHDYDVTLYDRFFNWEVAAGSFLLRNSAVSIDFLRRFAAYEFRLPEDSFHGTDNGALHMLLLEMLVTRPTRITRLCKTLWSRSRDYIGLFRMEACVKISIGEHINFPEQKLRILKKGTGWMRDIWLFDSLWSDDDFMLHAIKNERMVEYPDTWLKWLIRKLSFWHVWTMQQFDFVPPITQPFDLAQCDAGTAQWHLEARTHISNARRRELFEERAQAVEMNKFRSISTLRF